ncbi:helix-turn-helix domain-containing protein [Sporosarcina sp. CAU 1771]
MSNNFGKNLKYLRTKKHLEQLELAQLLGRKSASTISEWEKGTYTPKSGTLSDIAKIFNVSLTDLMERDLQKPTNIIEVSQRTVRIPVLGTISCGDPILAEANYEDYRIELADRLPSGNLFYLEAKGDSMYPEIPDGSMVLLREQNEVENGEIAAVMVNGNTEATLKRIKKQDGMMILLPVNPEYEAIFVTPNNPVQIIGKVIRSERIH